MADTWRQWDQGAVMLTAPKTSIRKKVTVLVLAATTMALLLAALTFLGYEGYAFRKASAQELSALGEIVAYNASAAVAFNDEGTAARILEGLKTHGHITRAQVFSELNAGRLAL